MKPFSETYQHIQSLVKKGHLKEAIQELGSSELADPIKSAAIKIESQYAVLQKEVHEGLLLSEQKIVFTNRLAAALIELLDIWAGVENGENGNHINIDYTAPDLQSTKSIQVNSLFISYSYKDAAFVDKLGEKFTEKGIRYWRDTKDATSGRLETQLRMGMRMNPTVLMVFSKHSVASDWVVYEAMNARKLEKELGKDVMCPIALDNSWKDMDWPGRLKMQIMEYFILDFGGWEDLGYFENVFAKLLNGLDLFYK